MAPLIISISIRSSLEYSTISSTMGHNFSPFLVLVPNFPPLLVMVPIIPPVQILFVLTFQPILVFVPCVVPSPYLGAGITSTNYHLASLRLLHHLLLSYLFPSLNYLFEILFFIFVIASISSPEKLLKLLELQFVTD